MNTSRPLVEINASPIEELVPGLTFQRIFDGRAFAFYAQHTSVALVDAWFAKIVGIATTWPSNRTLYILNDFSGKDCVVTPYNQQKNRELVKMFPHLQGVSALVLKQNLTMQLTRLFLRTTPAGKNVYLTFSQEDAVSWLKKRIDYDEATQESHV